MMGRPTKYKPEFVLEVDKYLETTGKEQTKLPTLQGFGLWIGCSMDALEDWRKLYPDFGGALGKLMLVQAEQLINDGIYGGKEVNATIVKLMLQNNHGMKERKDYTSDDKPMISFPESLLKGKIEHNGYIGDNQATREAITSVTDSSNTSV